MAEKKRPNIVSVHLPPKVKSDLGQACHNRGMTIKSLLSRLIGWFVGLDKTEQSIVLGQIEATDATNVAELISRRRAKKTGGASRTARRR